MKMGRFGMIARIKKLFLIFILSSTIIAPAFAKKVESNKSVTSETWITVFVHGVMSIKPHLSITNFVRFMTDNIRNTTYEETVRLMRQDTHFRKNQAMGKIGLHKIKINDPKPGNGSAATARLYQDMTVFANSTKKTDNHYYTFGWSGLFSHNARYAEARELYGSLVREVQKFKLKGISPKIRIIGYSHGGNICLNLGAVHDQENLAPKIAIDETILLGTPIQSDTDYRINSDVFKKVYHCYSRADRIQKLDFFSFNRLLGSNRIFKERKGFKLPKKLIQVQIKFTRRTKTKRKDKQMRALNDFTSTANICGTSSFLRDRSPGHIEFWFFGWTPSFYGQDFPLNPLPLVVYMPYIIHHLQKLEPTLDYKKPTIVDMRTEQEIMIVRNQSVKKQFAKVDFVPLTQHKKMSDIALTYEPKSFTAEQYDEHIQKAKTDAVEFRRKYRRHEINQRKTARRVRKKCKEYSEIGQPILIIA